MKADLLTDWLIGLTQGYSPFFSVYRFLIQTTIYLTVTALFIILFKLIFKNRIRAKWHFLIWIILLIRLAVPILPSSPVSVFNAAKVADDTIVQSSYYSYADNDTSTAERQDDGYTVAEGLHKMIESDQNESQKTVKPDYEYGNGISETTISQDYVSIINIDRIVIFTWMGGAVLLLLYFVIVYVVCIRRLKKQRSACDENINEILDSCKEQLKIKRNVRVYYADTTPTLIGIFRPTIYLPDTYSEAELRNVLLHELCHMKHMDVFWSLLAVLILCMNWFIPIIWVCFFLFKRDIEVYCDERTLRYAEDKQSYAKLLLKTATSRKERFVLGTTSLQSGKADVKRRIRFMANFKKPSVALVLIAVVLVGVMTTACLTNPISKDTLTNMNDLTDLLSINEKLGEPDLSDYNKTIFSKPPDILFADNSKAIIGGDCGIIVYSFEKEQITLYASYAYLRDFGLSIPFGNASSDGRYVYINDGLQSLDGAEQVNKDYLHLVLDTEERTITDNGYLYGDIVERYSIYDLDYDTKEEYGFNNNYVGGSYVEYGSDTIVYAQLKPNWEPENLSIVRYNKHTHETEEFKLFPNE